MLRKIDKKIIAEILVLTMIAGSITLEPGVSIAKAETTDEVKYLPEVSGTGKDTGKEEVIYVMTSADGTIESVNVVNILGKGDVTDYGSYSSVKMLNSTSAINKNGDEITFSTDKDKVYYQGTLENAQLPWNISVSYKLDGKEISADDVAGKNGNLSINIKITKNENCETSFYDDYALQASLTLDTNKCKNIKADNATLANVGADKQISYTVLPGKGLDAVINTDVSDFEMDAISINGVKLSLNIDIDNEELIKKVSEIEDAAESINNGATSLSDGTRELLGGADSLNQGASVLDAGINNMDTGVNSLNSGVVNMQDALNILNNQSVTLTDGSSNMLAALKTVQSELANVSVTNEQLKQLTDSSSAIKQGINDIYDGAVQLQGSLSYDSYKKLMGEGGLNVDELQEANLKTIESLSAQVNDLTDNINKIKSISNYESNETLVTQVAQLEGQVENLNGIINLLKANNMSIYGTSQYINEEYKAASQLVASLSELKTKYEAFDSAIAVFTENLSSLAVNVSRLSSAINQLVYNYEKLDSGIASYTDGVAQIVAAYGQIVTGTNTLAAGSSELVTGSSQLKQGVNNLYGGISALDEGAVKLNDGTREFYDQTYGLDEKIDDQINDMISSISGGDKEIVSFVSDKNKNVTSVQFVIKTASIQKPEVNIEPQETVQKLTFWQKLLKLFGLYK